MFGSDSTEKLVYILAHVLHVVCAIRETEFQAVVCWHMLEVMGSVSSAVDEDASKQEEHRDPS